MAFGNGAVGRNRSSSELVAQRALRRFGDKFDLESVAFLHVRRVVIGPAGMRMLVTEEQAPSVVCGGFGDAIDVGAPSTLPHRQPGAPLHGHRAARR